MYNARSKAPFYMPLPEPVIIDGWPVILIVPPPMDADAPLRITPQDAERSQSSPRHGRRAI